MSFETYQPIYDAIRSKITGCDISQAVESAIRDVNIGHYIERIASDARATISEYERPSVLFRPKIYPDGDVWCALYGENLQDGVCGFGKSPYLATLDFDRNFHTGQKPRRQKETLNENCTQVAL